MLFNRTSWNPEFLVALHSYTLKLFLYFIACNHSMLIAYYMLVHLWSFCLVVLVLYTYILMQKNKILWETIFILVLFRSCDGGAFRDVEPSADLYYSLDFTPKSSNSPSSSIITPRTLALAISPTKFSCCVRLFKWKRRRPSQLNSTSTS